MFASRWHRASDDMKGAVGLGPTDVAFISNCVALATPEKYSHTGFEQSPPPNVRYVQASLARRKKLM